jgi:hypothetical protein
MVVLCQVEEWEMLKAVVKVLTCSCDEGLGRALLILSYRGMVLGAEPVVSSGQEVMSVAGPQG